jgi:hypothetical protein
VLFLAVFTGIFYALGWYVRTRMKLTQSGIALSAVGSLFVPFDFYAFYLSGGFPRESWPQVWLLASLVCLVIYLLTTYLIQAEFFGYAVALAAGSTLAAILQVAGMRTLFVAPALAGLGLALALTAEGLLRQPASPWKLLARPFWHAALLGGTVILILQSSYWVLDETQEQAMRLALALDWWLGGLIFALGAQRYHSRWIGLAAAGSFPAAVLFSENLLFELWGIRAAWYAVGLALLAPLYLWLGRRFEQSPAGSAARLHARTLVLTGALLVLLAAWARPNPKSRPWYTLSWGLCSSCLPAPGGDRACYTCPACSSPGAWQPSSPPARRTWLNWAWPGPCWPSCTAQRASRCQCHCERSLRSYPLQQRGRLLHRQQR